MNTVSFSLVLSCTCVRLCEFALPIVKEDKMLSVVTFRPEGCDLRSGVRSRSTTRRASTERLEVVRLRRYIAEEHALDRQPQLPA